MCSLLGMCFVYTGRLNVWQTGKLADWQTYHDSLIWGDACSAWPNAQAELIALLDIGGLCYLKVD